MSDEWRHKRMGVKMWWMDHNDIIAFFCRSIISVREFRHSFTPHRARFRLILASSVNQPENVWRRVKRWRQTEKKTRDGRIKIPKIMVFQSIIHSNWLVCQMEVGGSRLTCPNIDSGAEWFLARQAGNWFYLPSETLTKQSGCAALTGGHFPRSRHETHQPAVESLTDFQ